MEELKLQVTELQKVKEKFTTLEQKYDISKINYAEEVRKKKGMAQQIKALEKDLTFYRPLAEIKKILWTNIIDSINDIWPSIQVIFEQTELVKMAIEAIHKTMEELGNKTEEANQLITFSNNKNRYQLDELEIDDRTTPIIEIKKVLTERNLMLNLEKRCQSIHADNDIFMKKYGILREKGLPSPW